jgi:hypothetical protein
MLNGMDSDSDRSTDGVENLSCYVTPSDIPVRWIRSTTIHPHTAVNKMMNSES